ncbi:MAG: RbsD/FucU family protein [Ktedonobacteraceae bacterium]
MLLTQLTHPTMLKALAGAGHGGKVLIADGNYPLSTATNPHAEHVYLNLRPGLVSAIDVLETLRATIPLEAAHVMQPNEGGEPPIFSTFRSLLDPLPLELCERFSFYKLASGLDVALAIATGDQRLYANVLLTIGVVQPQ